DELRIDQILVLFAITQCGYRNWSNVAMVCSSGGTLERVGHTDEFGVIPCAAEKLNGDRLPVIVEPGRHDDGWNAVRCAWCVPPPEARSWSTSIVYADLAQQSRIDDRVNTGMAGTRGIHPHLHDGLARYAIIPLRLDFGGCHPRRRRCGATRCIRSHICNFLLRAIHVHGAGDFKSLSGQLGMAVNVLHPSFRSDIPRRHIRRLGRCVSRSYSGSHLDDDCTGICQITKRSFFGGYRPGSTERVDPGRWN